MQEYCFTVACEPTFLEDPAHARCGLLTVTQAVDSLRNEASSRLTLNMQAMKHGLDNARPSLRDANNDRGLILYDMSDLAVGTGRIPLVSFEAN